MITQTVTVTEKGSQNIIIGRRNTYGTEVIVFDLSYLIETFGDGSAILMVKRANDASAYPAVTEQADNRLSWSVSDVDTSYKGHGECELFWYVDDALAKSVIYDITVLRDIGETIEAPPDPYQTWVDTLTDLGAETLENAQDAAQSAEDANTAKVAAETAQGLAETAQGKAEEAQQAAETAVTHYPKIVGGYWYVWQNGDWVNTGVKAEGLDGKGIASVTCVKTGTSGLVDTYTMTVTYDVGDPDTFQFLVTNGEDGYSPVVTITTITGGHRVIITDKTHPDGQSFDVTDGIDGVSPDVTITTITGGHRVTITDEDHPLGQSFDVMDGTNTDAEHVTYDDTASYSDGTVGDALNQLNSAITDLSINKADVIVSSASGAIASFPDGMNAPIKSMEVEIDPIQDLHGYDSPWPAGGGKNLIDAANFSGNTSGSTRHTLVESITLAAGTYTFSWTQTGNITGNVRNTPYYQVGSSSVYADSSENANLGNVRKTWTFTLAEETTLALMYWSHTITPASDYVDFQLESGSSATPFVPYANLCPISGHTGVTVEQNNRNILDPFVVFANYANYTVNSDGSVTVSGTDGRAWSAVPAIPIKAGTYTFSRKTLGGWCDIRLSTDNYATGNVMNDTMLSKTFTISEDGYYKVKVGYSASSYPLTGEYQIEVGSVVSPYVPHVGNTYPITFPSAADTVYGGTLVLRKNGSGEWSGELTVTMIGITVDTTQVKKEDDGWNTQGLNVFWISISSYGKGKYIYSSTVSNILANICIATSYNGLKSTADYNKIAFTGQGGYLEWTSPSTTLNEEKTRLTNTPMQAVYELATPIVYTLTAEQVGAVITTLYGDNNVWADTGDVSLDYRADTKLYIERLTAPTEDDLIANAPIASGKFFMVGNTLYLSTAAIASGAQITIGTNAVKLSLADALNQINS